VRLREAVVPPPAANLAEVPLEAVLRATGNPGRGRETATRCLMCHVVGGVGADVGPSLDGWGRGKSLEVIATAIIAPNAEVAHGFEAVELRTTDGLTIQGLQIKQGDPLMMRSMGGVTQIVPASRVTSRRRLERSLMMSAAQLGLTAQDVADLAAFLRTQ
jgi:putative heme-binding domain-containing protein